MASDALINLLIEVVRVGAPIVSGMVKSDTGKDLGEMTVSEGMQALRDLRIRSVDDLIAEGRKLAEDAKTAKSGEVDDGA